MLVTQVYSPVSFGKKYKAEQYIRRFVPELKDVPDKFIYEPHKMTMEKQKAANCVIGKVPPESCVCVAPSSIHHHMCVVNIRRTSGWHIL